MYPQASCTPSHLISRTTLAYVEQTEVTVYLTGARLDAMPYLDRLGPLSVELGNLLACKPAALGHKLGERG